MQKGNPTLKIVQGAVIAALYAALTILQSVLIPESTSMAVQFRAAEALTVLAFFSPTAIAGLTVGCIIANISSIPSVGAIDIVFGPLASLLAALMMYALRNAKLFGLPVFGLLMPAVFNGLVVGFELDFFVMNNLRFDFVDFLIQGGFVALGELAVLFVLGLPLYLMINKRHLAKQLKI